MRTLRAALKILALALITFVLVPCYAAIRLFTRSTSTVRLWHRLACAIFGIRVMFSGTPAQGHGKPLVYLVNHVSYLDIVALGGHVDARFVAKSEVADWPVFGFLAKLQNTVFIERRKAAIGESSAALVRALGLGDSIILFAEGTSTDGAAVKPFKPSLLETLYSGGVPVIVQPLAIVLESVDGQDVRCRQALRDAYAWWRPETTLAPHLWSFAQGSGACLAVRFLPAIDPSALAGRKDLAMAAHMSVSAVVEAASALR